MRTALNWYDYVPGFNTNNGLRPNQPHKKGLMSEAAGMSSSGGSFIEPTRGSVGWSVAFGLVSG